MNILNLHNIIEVIEQMNKTFPNFNLNKIFLNNNGKSPYISTSFDWDIEDVRELLIDDEQKNKWEDLLSTETFKVEVAVANGLGIDRCCVDFQLSINTTSEKRNQ